MTVTQVQNLQGEAQAQLLVAACVVFPDLQAIYAFGSFGTLGQRNDSDLDIAVLLPPGPLCVTNSQHFFDLRVQLMRIFLRDVDLVDLRRASTVLQMEILAADRCLYCANQDAADEFAMLTMSAFQKLNEERREILDEFSRTGRFYAV